jgi:UDP-N-acetylglucosamine pyrophosphorylase
MRGLPGFINVLQEQLEGVPLETLERVNRPGGLEVRDLLDFLVRPRDYTVHLPDPVEEKDVKKYTEVSREVIKLGQAAIDDNSTAFCILAGGAGTRIGVSKGFLRLPGTEVSLLSLKLLQAEKLKNVWVMSSPSNHSDVEKHLASLGTTNVKLFTQFESFRLTPDNQLYSPAGKPELHPCGHGDLVPALKHSGVLDEFVAAGGKRVIVVNVDNVLATPDPRIVGQHIESGLPVTCEVVERGEKDVGGMLCNHDGFNQIVEHFRMSSQTDTSQFRWLNTNTMVFDATLDFDSVQWSWHRVKKNVDNKSVIQYERLIQDLTSHFKTQFIEVTRSCRYMPVKTAQDLQDAARILGRKSV